MSDSLSSQRPSGDSVVDVQSPDLKGNLQKHIPALSNIRQAVEIVKSLEAENRDRSLKNARIKSKFDSEKPYPTDRLIADGQSWRTNISTRPLPMLVERIIPRFTGALKRMKYLTASALPGSIPGAAVKTEEFRRVVTETCRAREGWEDFIFELALENTLFGFVAAGNTGMWHWFPTVFSQVDSLLVPRGTKHNAKSCPVLALKEKALTYELFQVIKDREGAKLGGWEVQNTLESINKAVPEARRSAATSLELLYADLRRECSTISAMTGTTAVEIWHLFVAEVDGSISHVAYDATTEKQLFWRYKQFEKMSDIATFFSFQHGNGKLQGSKGVGRELYGMAGILDRARNEAIDRLLLSGKLVIQCAEGQINRYRMSVVGSTILISDAYIIQERKIDSNIKEFFMLDQFLTDLLDQNAGSTSPKQLTGERVTKAAVELYASRDEERSDALLDRFLTQFSRLMGSIQRRMCHPNCPEEDAKAAQKRLLTVMSREELDMLAKQPAISTVADLSDEQRKQIVLVTSEARGNPLYDQREIERRKVEALVNSEFAESILLPQNDPSVEAEQQRQQQVELQLLLAGQPVPVSSRDGHEIHLQILQNAIQQAAQEAVSNPAATQILAAMAEHATQHFQMLSNANPKAAAPFKQWIAGVQKTVQELTQLEQTTAPLAEPPPDQIGL